MFRRAKIILMACAACSPLGCASISVDQMHFYNGMVTVGGVGSRFEEAPMTSISQKDRFYVITHVSWDPPTADGGNHSVEWQWHSGDRLVVQRKRESALHFKKTPYRIWYTFPAADFQVGHYRVDVLIDDKVVDSHEFDITP
jgi:hypothetical protein